MSEEERVVRTVKANECEVVAKPLGVKKYEKKAEASEEEKKKAIEENVVGKRDSDGGTTSSDDADRVGDPDVSGT
jgi:hypothetical protein